MTPIPLAHEEMVFACKQVVVANSSHRHIFFYAPIAAMVLFLNIIIHPLDARAQPDCELLDTAAKVISDMPLGARTISEPDYLIRLAEFITELSRLGSCAVWKAKN